MNLSKTSRYFKAYLFLYISIKIPTITAMVVNITTNATNDGDIII